LLTKYKAPTPCGFRFCSGNLENPESRQHCVFSKDKKKKKKKIPVIFSSRTLSLPQPDRILFPWNWARFVTYDQSNAADI
jgi:hypothetical protein